MTDINTTEKDITTLPRHSASIEKNPSVIYVETNTNTYNNNNNNNNNNDGNNLLYPQTATAGTAAVDGDKSGNRRNSIKKSPTNEIYDLESGELSSQNEDKSSPDQISQENDDQEGNNSKKSAFKSLGFLDRYLFVWIFVAMGVGMILGNFVPNTGEALQKGQFIGVSIPIGMLYYL